MRIGKGDFQIYKLNIASFLRMLLLLNPVILLFYNENNLTVKELFLFQSVFYLLSIFLELPLGYFSDFINKKTALSISYILFLSAMLLWLFFHGYWIILVGEIILAVSKVILDNAQSSYLYDYLKYKQNNNIMTKEYATLNFYLAAGTTVASIIGTYIYSQKGSHFTLEIEVFIAIICLVLILSLKPVSYKNVTNKNFSKINIIETYINLFEFIKTTYKNKSIMYYIYYSGMLTSFSIVFALSFQPIMQKAMVPILFFGYAAFCNHGIRAIASIITRKVSQFFSMKSMIIPLFISYIIAFICIFSMLNIKNNKLVLLSVLLICIIIGFQLMFTIRHISRLHRFVDSSNRGKLISVNNLFSRSLTFLMLFSSKFFMDRIGFENYYLILFIILIFVGFFITLKTYKIKE